MTGAPPSFVHAFFQERPESELPAGKAAFMLGSIRWGRTDEQKAELKANLAAVIKICEDSMNDDELYQARVILSDPKIDPSGQQHAILNDDGSLDRSSDIPIR